MPLVSWGPVVFSSGYAPTKIDGPKRQAYVIEHQIPAREGGVVERLGSSQPQIKNQGFYPSGDVFKAQMTSLLNTTQAFSIPSADPANPFVSGFVQIESFKTGPAAGLDPMGEYKMMNLLKRLNGEKAVTIVMATHSVDLVPLFLDVLYILSKGSIIRGGIPEQVFTAPDEMSEIRLRLPQIAELIYRLRHEDRMPFDRIPLTIGEARREIMKTMMRNA